MSRSFNVSTPDYIYRAAPVTAAPFSISVWGNSLSVAANRVIVSLADTASDNNNFLIYHGTDLRIYFYIQAGAGSTQAGFYGTAAGSWWHACAIETAANNHGIYKDGYLHTSSASVTPSSIDRLAIGIRADLNPDLGANGLIASFGLWNVALTRVEVLNLFNGYPPPMIRPKNLVSYLPLDRKDNIDLVDGVIWTPVGSPGVNTDPKKVYPGLNTIHFAGSSLPISPPAGGGARSFGYIF